MSTQNCNKKKPAQRSAENTGSMPPGQVLPQIVGRKQLAQMLSMSVATIDRMDAAGRIGPQPIKLSWGRKGWRRSTIDAWVEESELAGELIDRKTWLTLTA